MKYYLRSIAFALFLLMSACSVETQVALPEGQCFNSNPVQELSWLKTVVSTLNPPYQVVGYLYRSKYFVGVMNTSITTPKSYIFSCDGTLLSKVPDPVQTDTSNVVYIDYSTFMANARVVQIFDQN